MPLICGLALKSAVDEYGLQYAVRQIAVRGRQRNLIALADIFERAEQPIAVRRECAVARHPRQRRIRQVSYRKVEHVVVLARFHWRRKMQTWNVEAADDAADRRNRRRRDASRALISRCWSPQRLLNLGDRL